MNKVPQISRKNKDAEKNKDDDELRPYIQIFKGSKAIFNELSK